MFKIGHYYRVNHRSSKCIIKVLRYISGDRIWEIKIIKLLDDDDIYYEGLITNWYEDWCFGTRELEDYESLVIEL